MTMTMMMMMTTTVMIGKSDSSVNGLFWKGGNLFKNRVYVHIFFSDFRM
jgi:hypothetical protein